jgi:hypothetical protein
MKKTYHIFLIAFALTILLGTGYLYFWHGLSSEAANTDSSLVSSSGGETPEPVETTNDKIAGETAFLNSLISLTTIKIDMSLLQNPSFVALHDNEVKIETVQAGRTNPFAPTQASSSSSLETGSATVVTNDATGITSTSANINGTINGSITPSAVYFEYGTADTLGKVTPNAVESLVNTFVRKLPDLTPKTTYYYRAAARINGTVSYGDIVSFTTN